MKAFGMASMAALANAWGQQDFFNAMIASNGNFEPLTITVNGQPKTVYVAHPNWYSGVAGNNVNLPEGSRSHFWVNQSYDANSVYRPNLLGGSVQFDVDLSNVGCGCIAAFYLVKMPPKDQNGNIQQTDGLWYCDGNKVGGAWCPEFDIMEANKYAFQTTAHSCTYAGNGHYSTCDTGGHCVQNSVQWFNHRGVNAFGPGSQNTIDTNRPFTFRVDFHENNGQFVESVVTVMQNGHTITTNCNDQSNTWMTEDIKNMGFALSNWSGNATWLWDNACYGSCNNPTLQFSNIRITTIH